MSHYKQQAMSTLTLKLNNGERGRFIDGWHLTPCFVFNIGICFLVFLAANKCKTFIYILYFAKLSKFLVSSVHTLWLNGIGGFSVAIRATPRTPTIGRRSLRAAERHKCGAIGGTSHWIHAKAMIYFMFGCMRGAENILRRMENIGVLRAQFE